MGKINAGRAALGLGTFAAVMHVIWDIMVAAGWAGPFLNLWVSLHAINPGFIMIEPFNLGTAVILVIYAFVFFYIVGWIFATCWNMFKK